jgi:hypothetical protein
MSCSRRTPAERAVPAPNPAASPGLNCRREPLSFLPMHPCHTPLPSLVLAALLLLHGVVLGVLPTQRPAPAASRTALTASAGQPGLPLPEHDETTCAVCHASATLTPPMLARAVLPDAPATVLRSAALADERLPRAPAARPTSSRAPPAIRSA